jgi:hypothetical protein
MATVAYFPHKHEKKWDRIIGSFMENRIDDLMKIHRTGTRGRIFSALVTNMLNCLEVSYQAEPIFDHKMPNEWYVNFANKNGIKLRFRNLYNPDYVLNDGSWIEVTISENTAYKKLFCHGHQADLLTVIWLDVDNGFHKSVCQNIHLPNSCVINIDHYYDKLRRQQEGRKIIEKFESLKELKGIIS